jgi:predicted metalloprotease with PDZ domain
MRAAYQKYAGPRGFTPDQFREVAEGVAGTSLRAFWDGAIRGISELDYREALDTFGLRFRAPGPASARAWLGITTRVDGGRLLVSQVRRDTPGLAAGLNVDDEILAIDDFRVRADAWDARLQQYRPGDRVQLLVARRDQLLRLPTTFGAEPPREWRLETISSSSDAQKARLAEWLRPAS